MLKSRQRQSKFGKTDLINLEHKQVSKIGTEPAVQKGERSLLVCHTRCKLNILFCLFQDRLNAADDKLDKLMNTVQGLVQKESGENEAKTVLEGMSCFTYDILTEL